VQRLPKILERLPAKALRTPNFDPQREDEQGDAAAYVRSVQEAVELLSEVLVDPDVQRDGAVLRLLRSFARATEANVEHVKGLVAAGAGLRGRAPEPLLRDLALVVAALENHCARIDFFDPPQPKNALPFLRAAIGMVKGDPANAMDDERALYDDA
jgi:hypothetical protein